MYMGNGINETAHMRSDRQELLTQVKMETESTSAMLDTLVKNVLDTTARRDSVYTRLEIDDLLRWRADGSNADTTTTLEPDANLLSQLEPNADNRRAPPQPPTPQRLETYEQCHGPTVEPWNHSPKGSQKEMPQSKS